MVRAQDSSDSITVSPNPCVPAIGQQSCTVNVSWTELENTTKTYQVVVQTDDGVWKLFSCIPPNNPLRSQSASWILPHHDYRFALRKGAASCSAIDPLATVAAPTATASAITAKINASTNRVVTSGSGSVTVDWLAAYRTYNQSTAAYVPSNNQVWVSVDYGPWSLFACSGAGLPGSATASWIQAGHTYRFSLNPTPNGCGDSSTKYPEVAAVTVEGVANYLQATPNRCSVATGGSCATALTFGTSVTGVTPQVWEYNGTAWTKLAHCPPTTADLNRTVPAGKTYKYELHLPTTCTATQASTPAVATTTMSALSDFVVREGTSLKLGGQLYKLMGLNKPELFQLYLQTRDQSDYIACNAPPDETCCPEQPDGACFGTTPVSAQCLAEHDAYQAAQAGAKFLRIAGTSFYAGYHGLNGAEVKKFWASSDLTCQTLYQQKFDAMLAYANSIGLKIISNFGWRTSTFSELVGTFPGHTAEDPLAIINQPASLSRKLLLRYAQDMLDGCQNLPAIPELGLPGGCNGRMLNMTGRKNDTTLLGFEIKVEEDLDANINVAGQAHLTTDQLVAFSRSFSESLRGWDPNHLLQSNTTALRPSEAHLTAWPDWVPSSGFQCLAAGDAFSPDGKWCQDDPNMYQSLVEYLHPEPIDVAGVHAYNNGGNSNAVPLRDNMRFGLVGPYNVESYRYYKRAADRIGRPLEVGEFEEYSDCDGTHPPPQCNQFPGNPRRPYARGSLKRIAALHLPLASPWVWQMHFGRMDDPFQIVPGANGGLDDQFMQAYWRAANLVVATTTTIDASPPNSDFETDANADGIPDGWTPAGGVVAGAPFNGKTVHLQKVGTTLGSLTSPRVSFGIVPPPNSGLWLSVAGRTNGLPAAFAVVEMFDATGALLGNTTATVNGTDFMVADVPLALPANTRSIDVVLTMGSASFAEFDDVNVLLMY